MPSRGVAAVLVLLHIVPETGELAVTLTTRSRRLKSHPGDTALPGGRVDVTDESVVSAALREANEEIGLPIEDISRYGYVGTLEPFLSRNLLVVYPVVYIYLHPASDLLDNLQANPDEVSDIFHLPLKKVLDAKVSEHSSIQTNDSLFYSSRDLKWINGTPYRWHSFNHPSFPSPLAGLTADIIIAVAVVAYGVSNPEFGFIKAPNQEGWDRLIEWALDGQGGGKEDEHSLIYKPPTNSATLMNTERNQTIHR